MSDQSESTVDLVTPSLLRQWPLPDAGASKYGRGRVLVVGGAARTPGSVLLAGEAALRVGAGHLQLAVAESTAAALAVAVPEAGVTSLPQTASGSVRGTGVDRLADAESADVVLVGPGLDDADEAAEEAGTCSPAPLPGCWPAALGSTKQRAGVHTCTQPPVTGWRHGSDRSGSSPETCSASCPCCWSSCRPEQRSAEAGQASRSWNSSFLSM